MNETEAKITARQVALEANAVCWVGTRKMSKVDKIRQYIDVIAGEKMTLNKNLVKQAGSGYNEEVVDTEEEIFIPPDTTAQIFWLKNRKPEKWRDKLEQEKTDRAAEVLKNMQTSAEVLRNPVSNRNIENYK